MDYKSIIKDIKNKQFKPIYALHGEEPYFIDAICDAIIENALEEHERDFNQTVFYGRDADPLAVVSEAKGFPMMSERRLVVLREAQDMKDIYALESYCAQPNPSTVFVICHKYKALDGKRKMVKELASTGLVFKSEKVKEYQLNDWISNYVKGIGFDITSKAAALLGEFLGNDLGRIVNELEKLSIVLEKGTRISDIHIEENIGISKDYNNFELTNAIAKRDSLKVFQIAHYFERNPKDHSIIAIISNLFGFYTNLMRIHFLPNKNPDAVATSLRVHPFVAKELMLAANQYPPKILASNVAILHEYDLKAKGVGNSTFTEGELMREMLYKLMN
jgi:DNA polymerase-3 subunit delta